MYGAVFGRPEETEQAAVSCLERTPAWLRWSRVADDQALCNCMHASADSIETVRSSFLVGRQHQAVMWLDSGKAMNRWIAPLKS